MEKSTILWVLIAASAASFTLFYFRKRKSDKQDRERCRPFNRTTDSWEYTL